MIIKLGQYGLFASCDRFPNCRNTMKLNYFLYDILKKDGIFIYSWDHECWKCHKNTKVYTYFLNKQLKPYMEEHVELDNLGLGSCIPIDEYLRTHYPTINNNFSKTQNCYCTANNCEYCGALIGNHYIVDDPHDIFQEWLTGDLHRYIFAKIPLEELKLTSQDFRGLENYFVQIF